MEFKIRNEYTPIWINLIILPVLWFISILFLPLTSANVELHGIALIVCVALMALLALALILYFVDKAIGAVIKVDDTTVKVSSLFVRKKIAIDEIEDMEIEDYQRRVVRRTEYRMKLTIFYTGGKKLVLQDNASEVNGFAGFVTGERIPMPDQDVTVYQACKYIESKMKK